MKRFINWVKDTFNKRIWQESIAIVIGIVVWIIFGILSFGYLDRVPATTDDYVPLEQQIVAIQENHDLLFSTDNNTTVEDNIITITLANQKCKLTVKFDQTFNVLDTNYVDLSFTLVKAIISSIVNGFLIGFIISLVSYFVLWILYFFIWLGKKIYSKFNKQKK